MDVEHGLENLKERDHYGDLGVDGRTVFSKILATFK
jgi:hypothetical protein